MLIEYSFLLYWVIKLTILSRVTWKMGVKTVYRYLFSNEYYENTQGMLSKKIESTERLALSIEYY